MTFVLKHASGAEPLLGGLRTGFMLFGQWAAVRGSADGSGGPAEVALGGAGGAAATPWRGASGARLPSRPRSPPPGLHVGTRGSAAVASPRPGSPDRGGQSRCATPTSSGSPRASVSPSANWGPLAAERGWRLLVGRGPSLRRESRRPASLVSLKAPGRRRRPGPEVGSFRGGREELTRGPAL